MNTNRTHRTRLARALAAVDCIGYQQALARVIHAAETGLLPDPLDAAGMRRALDQLACTNQAEGAITPLALAPRYQRLAQIFPGRLQPGVQGRVARARALGVPAVRCRGSYDPAEILDAVAADIPGDARADWWHRVVAAGPRLDCDATGDVDAYEQALRAITRREPRDIDARAHLGNLYLDLADHSSTLVVTPPPDQRQRRAWLRTALGHYQTAVGVAELALPVVWDPLNGGMVTESRTTELRWIFRPRQDRPDAVRALAGVSIYSAGPVGPDGEADLVLRDGARVRATSAEIVAE